MLTEFDELDEVMAENTPDLEERLEEYEITREEAIELASQCFRDYRELAENCGLTTLHKPFVWVELLDLCRQELTPERFRLLIWLCSGGELSQPDSTDEAVAVWLNSTEYSCELTDFLAERREKNAQFREIVEQAGTAKQNGFSGSGDRHLQVFNALCEAGFADSCQDRNILLNNLSCIDGMIAELPFLKPVEPLVYYQVCVHNSRKLLEKPDFLPTLKNLFRRQEYNIYEDNGKNYEQYLDYCELYVVLKDCFPDADEPLCDAGFAQLSNLPEYCFEHAESGGRIPLTPPLIARLLPGTLFDIPAEEIPIWNTLAMEDCDGFALRQHYSALWEAAENTVSRLSLKDISKFIRQGEELVSELLCGKLAGNVSVRNFYVARKLLVSAINNQFEDALSYELEAVFAKLV